MKPKTALLAALFGGLALFIWGAFSHMAIPLWEKVMHELPNQQAILDALKATNSGNGLYYGKQGILLCVKLLPGGADMSASMGGYMLIEFISDCLAALVFAWVLARMAFRGMWQAAICGAVIGLIGWLAINVSYWNWYGFPFGYILLEAFDGVLGMFWAGLIIGWLLKRAKPAVA